MRGKAIAGLLLASAAFASALVVAEDAQLIVKPDKCVALRKGETCYQSVLFRYTAPYKSDVCLVRDDEPEPLICWKNTAKAEFRYSLASSTSIWFHTINPSQTTTASAVVKVAWVYRQSRKRNQWRLF